MKIIFILVFSANIFATTSRILERVKEEIPGLSIKILEQPYALVFGEFKMPDWDFYYEDHLVKSHLQKSPHFKIPIPVNNGKNHLTFWAKSQGGGQLKESVVIDYSKTLHLKRLTSAPEHTSRVKINVQKIPGIKVMGFFTKPVQQVLYKNRPLQLISKDDSTAFYLFFPMILKKQFFTLKVHRPNKTVEKETFVIGTNF